MGETHHDKALGNLHTLSSPFFRDEYTPEAPILKAVILYARCDFRKALIAVNEFNQVYYPLLLELDGYVQDFADPKALYNFLRRMQADPSSSPRVSQILNALFADRELKRINAHITEMERELQVIQKTQSRWSTSDLANYVVQTIEVTRDSAFDKAGQMAKARLQRVAEELRKLKDKADSKSFTEKNLNKVFYYNGKQAVLDILNYKIIKSKKLDKNLIDLGKLYKNKEIPIMPIGAKILMNKYQIKEGKQLGSKLKMVEKEWVENNFKISNYQVDKIINS